MLTKTDRSYDYDAEVHALPADDDIVVNNARIVEASGFRRSLHIQ